VTLRAGQRMTSPPVSAPGSEERIGAYGLKASAIVGQHVVALVALAGMDGAPAPYLLLVLFDLGVSYLGPHLQSQGALSTREFVAFAQDATERVFAWLLMPALMALAGMLFIATAALFLVPVLLAAGAASNLLDSVHAELAVLGISTAAISIAAALCHDDAMVVAQSAQMRRAAGLAVVALAMRETGLWLAAGVFALIQCIVDIKGLRRLPSADGG
jgi:hypothetical protein